MKVGWDGGSWRGRARLKAALANPDDETLEAKGEEEGEEGGRAEQEHQVLRD